MKYHSTIPLKLQRKNIEPTVMDLKQFFIMWVKMSVMTSLKYFYIISKYFPIVSEWLCLSSFF